MRIEKLSPYKPQEDTNEILQTHEPEHQNYGHIRGGRGGPQYGDKTTRSRSGQSSGSGHMKQPESRQAQSRVKNQDQSPEKLIPLDEDDFKDF